VLGLRWGLGLVSVVRSFRRPVAVWLTWDGVNTLLLVSLHSKSKSEILTYWNTIIPEYRKIQGLVDAEVPMIISVCSGWKIWPIAYISCTNEFNSSKGKKAEAYMYPLLSLKMAIWFKFKTSHWTSWNNFAVQDIPLAEREFSYIQSDSFFYLTLSLNKHLGHYC